MKKYLFLFRIWLKNLFPKKDLPYYDSCRVIPLENFMWCLTKGDVWYLMKKGYAKVSKKVLEPVWNDIFFEYLSISKDTEHVQMLMLMKEITSLNTRYILMYEIIRQLSIKHNPILIQQLRRMGFTRFRYDFSDRKQYYKELEVTMSQAKALYLKSDQKKKELEALQAKKSGKNSESDYEELLTEMSKFQGYRINPKEVTVSEFVGITNRYKKHVENQRKNGQFGKNK